MDEFAEICRQAGIADPGLFRKKCEQLRELLVEGNKICNLTRILEPGEFFLKHVADSLLIALEFPELTQQHLAVADVGCGAGFPALILALAFPAWEICAIDSTGKKIDFVRRSAEFFHLHQLNAVHGRAVELNRKAGFQRRFDLVTARAVAPSFKIAAETTAFLRKNGFYAFYKTPDQAQEELPVLGRDKKYRWSCGKTYALSYGNRCFVTGRGTATALSSPNGL